MVVGTHFEDPKMFGGHYKIRVASAVPLPTNSSTMTQSRPTPMNTSTTNSTTASDISTQY